MNNNILNYTKRLLAIMIVLLIGNSVLTSCDDDEENTQVVLNSFGPAGVKHGDIISFIGLNLDRVTAIVLPDGGGSLCNAVPTVQSRHFRIWPRV